MLNKLDPKKFASLAKRYVWWETEAWACKHPDILLANIMNLGSWDDIQTLRNLVDEKTLKELILNTPAGLFTQRSWDYWHCKLGIHPIPPLPKRKLI